MVSLGHQNFVCRSYCGLSRRMQGQSANILLSESHHICIAQTRTIGLALCVPEQACICDDSSVYISFIFTYFV